MQATALSSGAAESATPVPGASRDVTCPACGARFARLSASTIYIRDAERVFRELLTFGLILAAVVSLVLLFLGAHFAGQPAA